jgi:hypothetical protein
VLLLIGGPRFLYYQMKLSALLFAATFVFTQEAIAAPPPTRVGQCSNTFIKKVSSRFGAKTEEFGSDQSIVELTNGLGVYLYRKLQKSTYPGWGLSPESEPIPRAEADGMFRPNDKVKLCMEYIPDDCDARTRLGDRRGEIYFLVNFRNNAEAFGQFGRNGCGGA